MLKKDDLVAIFGALLFIISVGFCCGGIYHDEKKKHDYETMLKTSQAYVALKSPFVVIKYLSPISDLSEKTGYDQEIIDNKVYIVRTVNVSWIKEIEPTPEGGCSIKLYGGPAKNGCWFEDLVLGKITKDQFLETIESCKQKE